ncbi:MAG: EVE domain-containing protein [Ferruginibacter sp.]
MNFWLIKSEPGVYSWDQFLKDKSTSWDGIRNYAARNHLKSMKKGDKVFFYHSNSGTEIVGIAVVIKESYPDPTTTDDRWVAVRLKPFQQLKKRITLAEIKKEKNLSQMGLVKIGRLSVSPVSMSEWEIILKMSGEN